MTDSSSSLDSVIGTETPRMLSPEWIRFFRSYATLPASRDVVSGRRPARDHYIIPGE